MQQIQQNFAVAGNPVSHSLSPLLFDDFAKQNGKNYFYSRILSTNVNNILEIVNAFDIKGLNITSPFKQDILQFVDIKSEEVNILNAANTIVFNENINAFNTDVSGVINSLKKYINTQKKAIVLGAGGAAKAAVQGLKILGIEDIFIANRTKEKAKQIADKFDINYLLFENIKNEYFSIIINTIPVLIGEIGELKVNDKAILFDANYKNKPLKTLATQNNAVYIDGLEWLKEQGKEAYFKMTGIKNNNLYLQNKDIEKIKKRSQRLAMIGPMASGKSKVGRNLAKILGFDFVDMDDIIVVEENRSITNIFEESGEDYFREKEKQLLKKLVKKNEIVISTGGGVIKDDENINVLKNNCWNIMLYSSAEVRSSRINTDKRPLLKGKDVKSTMEKLFSERKNNYFKTSDIIVNRNENTLEKDIKLIYEDYSKTFGI